MCATQQLQFPAIIFTLGTSTQSDDREKQEIDGAE